MEQPTFISIHTPKCAGSSVRSAIREHFGTMAFFDYGDGIGDPASPWNVDPLGQRDKAALHAAAVTNYQIVHGHFHPDKYDDVPNRRYITYMRDPVERALSHFFYWKSREPSNHSVWRYVCEYDVNFEEFCRLPSINRLYSGYFFAGFDLAKLSLVGFADRMDCFAEQMNKRFGLKLAVGQENRTVTPAYREAKSRWLDTPKTRAKLTDFFREDLELYSALRGRFA